MFGPDLRGHFTKTDIDFGMRSCKGDDELKTFGCGFDWELRTPTDCRATDSHCATNWFHCSEWSHCLSDLYDIDWTLPDEDEPDLIRYGDFVEVCP